MCLETPPVDYCRVKGAPLRNSRQDASQSEADYGRVDNLDVLHGLLLPDQHHHRLKGNGTGMSVFLPCHLSIISSGSLPLKHVAKVADDVIG